MRQMPDFKHFRILPALFFGLLAFSSAAPIPAQAAMKITTPMMNGTDFRAYGLTQFAIHGYELKREMVNALNFGLKNLIQRHEQTFGRRLPRTFTVRYRIFERFEDYQHFAQVKYKKRINKNVLGFFSPRGREIVTWKQDPVWRLLPTAQHEGCHAIMNAMFGPLPFWMIEGSADWFGEEPAWLQTKFLVNDKRDRWQRLDVLRRTGKLPRLDKYLLTDNYNDWAKMFDDEIGMGYDVGWSIFDFFVSAGQNAGVDWPQKIMAGAVHRAQQNPNVAPELVFARTLHEQWPMNPARKIKGIQSFEHGWHFWIEKNAKEAARAKIIEQQKRKQQR
ncbi:MAG: hypothetical protein CMO64_07495 [Verrucomicrobiales bacterium]|nr:hypothetical protein [Verrucomicrobiales bacterium]